MKYPILGILLLCSYVLIAQSIHNQGFEQIDTAFSSGLKFWTSNQAYESSADENVLHAGQYAMNLRSVDGKDFGTFSQMVQVPPAEQLRKFRVSAYLKRADVEQFSGIWVNVFNGDSSLFFDNMYNRQLRGTADWEAVSTEFFVDITATQIRIGGLLVGRGQVWFDDFYLEEVPLLANNLPDSLLTYLTEAFDIVQQNALNRGRLNWGPLKEKAFLMASGATSYTACYPVIRYVLNSLGDHHSFLMEASTSQNWLEPAPDAYKNMPLTTGKIMDGEFAYLKMPAVNSGNEQANTYFADQLHDLLENLDRSKPRGWILDLRENVGGNCWPMLAGIGPLLGEGRCGYFIDASGTASEPWFYKSGRSGIGKNIITKLKRKPYKLRTKAAAVVVLTGPRTASSGEVVTIAFRKRPNTWSVGEPTAGLSTGNQNFMLRDGAQIFLTSSVYADRNLVPYGGKVVPDEIQHSAPDGSDLALEAAIKWLAKRGR